MTIQVNDVIRATARMKWDNLVDVQNTFWLRLASGDPLVDAIGMDDIAEWMDDMYGEVTDLLPTSLTFEDIDFFNITQDTPLGSATWPSLTTGTSGSNDVAATGVAGVVTAFSTIVRVHGRKFIGPLVESVITSGYLESTAVTALAAFALDWITPFTGATSGQTWQCGVYRRVQETWQAFRDAVARNIPGYQRRRKAGVGS